jgi:oligosaccharide repeat unit polymerase
MSNRFSLSAIPGNSPMSPSGLAWLVLYAVSALVPVLVGIRFSGVVDVTIENLLVAFLFILLFAPVLINVAMRRFDAFESINLFIVAYGLFFGADILISYDSLRFASSFRQTLVITIASLGAFYVGYYSRLAVVASRALPVYPPRWNRRRVFEVLVVFFLIGSVSYVVFFRGDFLYLFTHANQRKYFFAGRGYLAWGAGLIYFLFFIYHAFHFQTKTSRLVLVLFFVLAVFTYGSGGARAGLISIGITILAMHHYLRKRMGLLKVLVVGSVLSALFFAYGIARLDIHKFVARPDRILHADLVMLLSEDIGGFRKMLGIVKGAPAVLDYQHGRTYLSLLLYPVPRSVFPGKPPALGTIYTKAFYPSQFASGVTQGVTILGEGYLNFGVCGAILAMVLLGTFCGALYRYLRVNQGNSAVVLIYAASLIFIVAAVKGGLWDMTVGFLQSFIPLHIAIRYSTKGKRN